MAGRAEGLPDSLVWNFSQVFGDRVDDDDEIADGELSGEEKGMGRKGMARREREVIG